MDWFFLAMSKYAVFEGRSQRAEYWYFVLFNVLIGFVGGLLDVAIGKPVMAGVLFLAFFTPSLAVFIRRMHDIGKSGWWFFISLIPVVGWIWAIVLLCTDSEKGENQYGKNPKQKEKKPVEDYKPIDYPDSH